MRNLMHMIVMFVLATSLTTQKVNHSDLFIASIFLGGTDTDESLFLYLCLDQLHVFCRLDYQSKINIFVDNN